VSGDIVPPSLHIESLAKTRWSEYAIRFAFGGAVTVATGLIAHAYGPGIGGLFLAFPAILPASLTLLKEHDGRDEAAAAADGSRLGAIGLLAFALVTAALAATTAPPLTLAAATLAWAFASILLWRIVYGSRDKRVDSPRKRRVRGALQRRHL
jgi:hypothetical protein